MPKRKADWEFYKALYLGEIATTDHYLAELLDWLEAESLLDETLYMLTSDHGEEFKDHDSVGHGHTLYQELLHVPLLLRWPALGLAGHRVRTAVEAIDIGPTLLAAAGIEAPDRWQGASLLPLLRAPEPPMPRAAFAEMGGIATSAWLPPYKLIRYHAWGGKDLLFDLSSDPGEKENLAKRSPMAMKLMGRHLEIFEGVRGTWRKPVDGALGDPTKLLGGDPGRAASLEDERTTAGPASAGD